MVGSKNIFPDKGQLVMVVMTPLRCVYHLLFDRAHLVFRSELLIGVSEFIYGCCCWAWELDQAWKSAAVYTVSVPFIVVCPIPHNSAHPMV